MALEDLFELSAMIKVQLPILYSFCVIRWLASILVRVSYHAFTPLVFRKLVDVGIKLARRSRTVALLGLIPAQIYCVLVSPPPSDVCAEYSSVRAQGMHAMTALAVIFASGSFYAMGLSLATLKSVADTSSASIMIASCACVAVVHDHAFAHPVFGVLGLCCAWYSYTCAGAAHDTLGGPSLAICFTLLSMLMRVCRIAYFRIKTVFGYAVRRSEAPVPQSLALDARLISPNPATQLHRRAQAQRIRAEG